MCSGNPDVFHADSGPFVAGWSMIPEASIMVSILSESESELVLADGIDSSDDSSTPPLFI